MHRLENKPASLTEIKDFLSQPCVTGSPRLWRGRIDIRLGEQTKFRYANQRFAGSLIRPSRGLPV